MGEVVCCLVGTLDIVRDTLYLIVIDMVIVKPDSVVLILDLTLLTGPVSTLLPVGIF